MTESFDPQGRQLDPETFAKRMAEHLASSSPPARPPRRRRRPKKSRRSARNLSSQGLTVAAVAAICIGTGLALATLVVWLGGMFSGPGELAAPEPSFPGQAAQTSQPAPGSSSPAPADSSATPPTSPTTTVPGSPGRGPFPFVTFPTPTTSTTTTTLPASPGVPPTSPPVTTAPDTTPPTVGVTTPASGASYEIHSSVLADYSCTDSGSGVASCVGTVAQGSPIDTSSLGSKSFTVTATDNAGNTKVAEITYMVVDP